MALSVKIWIFRIATGERRLGIERDSIRLFHRNQEQWRIKLDHILAVSCEDEGPELMAVFLTTEVEGSRQQFDLWAPQFLRGQLVAIFNLLAWYSLSMNFIVMDHAKWLENQLADLEFYDVKARAVIANDEDFLGYPWFRWKAGPRLPEVSRIERSAAFGIEATLTSEHSPVLPESGADLAALAIPGGVYILIKSNWQAWSLGSGLVISVGAFLVILGLVFMASLVSQRSTKFRMEIKSGNLVIGTGNGMGKSIPLDTITRTSNDPQRRGSRIQIEANRTFVLQRQFRLRQSKAIFNLLAMATRENGIDLDDRRGWLVGDLKDLTIEDIRTLW